MTISPQPRGAPADTRAMRFATRSEMALYLWDYFYITNVPRPGDEKPWRMIENATTRIRDSETKLRDSVPPDVRLQHARRIHTAVQVARRNIEQLSTTPDAWIFDSLDDLEVFSFGLMQSLREMVGRSPTN